VNSVEQVVVRELHLQLARSFWTQRADRAQSRRLVVRERHDGLEADQALVEDLVLGNLGSVSVLKGRLDTLFDRGGVAAFFAPLRQLLPDDRSQ